MEQVKSHLSFVAGSVAFDSRKPTDLKATTVETSKSIEPRHLDRNGHARSAEGGIV